GGRRQQARTAGGQGRVAPGVVPVVVGVDDGNLRGVEMFDPLLQSLDGAVVGARVHQQQASPAVPRAVDGDAAVGRPPPGVHPGDQFRQRQDGTRLGRYRHLLPCRYSGTTSPLASGCGWASSQPSTHRRSQWDMTAAWLTTTTVCPGWRASRSAMARSEEHTSELQSRENLV